MNCYKSCKDIYCKNARTCLKEELGGWVAIQPRCVRRYLLRKKPKQLKVKQVTHVERLYFAGHKLECACCGVKYPLTFDHIIPKSKGGTYDLSNGQILCIDCNFKKADKIISLDELRNILGINKALKQIKQ